VGQLDDRTDESWRVALTRAVSPTVARSAPAPPTGLNSLIAVLYEPLARNVSADTTRGTRERGPASLMPS
jgi:hypothetical protein